MKEADEKKKQKVKEKAIGDGSRIQSKFFDKPSTFDQTDMSSPVLLMSEMGKTASTIAKKEKKSKMKRGNSISNLNSNLSGVQKAYRDDLSMKSRGSTRDDKRQGDSENAGSASQNRSSNDFKRGRTLTPQARRTTKHDKFPQPPPMSIEDQAMFDENREQEILAEAAAKKERARAIRDRQEKQLNQLKAKMGKEKADKDAEEQRKQNQKTKARE